jgi:hypothetical protein
MVPIRVPSPNKNQNKGLASLLLEKCCSSQGEVEARSHLLAGSAFITWKNILVERFYASKDKEECLAGKEKHSFGLAKERSELTE